MNGGLSRLDMARGQVTTLKGQLQDALAKRESLKRELAATPQSRSADGTPGAPSRLKQAQDQLAELQLRYTDEHPDIIALKKLIPTLRNEGGSASGSRADSNPLYEQLKVRLIDVDGEVASLQRQVKEGEAQRDRLDAMARAAPGVHAESENLDRDYNVLRRNYEELLSRRESANIAQAASTQAEKVKLQVVDPPQIPTIPVAPNRLILIPAVLLAGIGGGAGLAYLLGQLDRSFYTLDDLRDIGIPVLGGISVVGPAPVRRHLASTIGFSAAVLLLVVVCGGLLTHILRATALV